MTRPLPELQDTVYYSEVLSEKNISIYPNMACGILKVEVRGYDSSDNCILSIFDMSGQRLLSTGMTSTSVELDISSFQDGVYVLYLLLNGKESTWKVVKK
ncbi:MAG: T9SS type A sorting domain-containing protein [Bacteroidales bacterium]|nr:T9SS type A sorting domain-containing protein [Bacteroidales bacterium]MCM1147144.1 T9SS type A sorting domain-containing protein [Bacteroidales bacterium]MCM1205370.1 T9SS type A sorting domain-containing protein [Bacillota bacterium]MCM1509825.1 T9SS type A sorting domain-containing protein [Clostridium sp.]